MSDDKLHEVPVPEPRGVVEVPAPEVVEDRLKREHGKSVARALATSRPLFTAEEAIHLCVSAMEALDGPGQEAGWGKDEFASFARSMVAGAVTHKNEQGGHEFADGAFRMAELLRDAEHALSPALGFLRLDISKLAEGARGDRVVELLAELLVNLRKIEPRMEASLEKIREGTGVARTLGIDPFLHAVERVNAERQVDLEVGIERAFVSRRRVLLRLNRKNMPSVAGSIRRFARGEWVEVDSGLATVNVLWRDITGVSEL